MSVARIEIVEGHSHMIIDGVRRNGGKPPLILVEERVVGAVQKIDPGGIADNLLSGLGVAE